MEDKIKNWEVLTNSITEDWIVKYFELDEEERAYSIDYSWVANDVGGIFEFADMFFNFSDVLECYKHKITKEQLFLWYDWCLSNPFVNISLAKYILSPKENRKTQSLFECINCGYTENADLQATFNLLQRGQSLMEVKTDR